MKVFAISDLHLSINNDKPMDIFGPVWEGYLEKIENDWNEKVGDELCQQGAERMPQALFPSGQG